MKTLFTVGLLVVFTIVANFLTVFLLNLAGVPGALVAGKPEKRGKVQFVAGSLVSALGQSLVYLGYVAFVVNWTRVAISVQNVSVMVWPVAFLAVMLPIWINLIRARLEAREASFANPQVEALHITTLVALLGFFLFAFVPNAIEPVYGWLPYVHSDG
ncbi:MAG: hypothetical protein V4530_17015 [Pseudomonadota bacterium]